MRTQIVDGVEYLCPRYVVRVKGGWQTRLPKEKTIFFADSAHSGPAGSHDAAVDWRSQRLPLASEDQAGRYLTTERSDKKTRLGTPGIFLQEKKPRPGHGVVSQFELLVLVRGQPSRTIYVGTANTYRARLAEKLRQAESIREEKLKAQALAQAARG